MLNEYSSDFYSSEIEINISKFYKSRIKVTVISIPGSTILMKNDSTVITAKETNGRWVFYPDKFGVWIIEALKGTDYAKSTIQINSVKEYEKQISY